MDKSEFFKNARTDLTGPLAGVRVVETTTTWAGPMVGCVLADYGADVIKIEHPTGEVVRRIPPLIPDTTETVANQTVNRNKRNLSLELRSDTGRRIYLELCATADIVVENFRPGTLDEWKVGYADVRVVKPDIVFVSVSGYGQFGEFSDRVGYDPLAQAYSGFASLNGDPDSGPVKAPTFLGDDLAGLHGALGAMAALRHRDQTGEGQHVDIALVDSLLFQSDGFPTAGALKVPMPKWGNQFSFAAPVNIYPCTDGVVYAGVLLDSHWRVLAGLLERSDLADLDLAARMSHRREELDELLAGWCATRTVGEVVSTFAERGLPACPVNSYADIASDGHIASRDILQTVTLPDGTEVPITAPAAKLSRTPLSVRRPAPTIGEHNAEILAELGYGPDEIHGLVAEGAIGPTGG
ncbi:MAG: CoA transferase [Gammaproteobacteria bacterium]|jgi:formyl-CoA transferase